MIIGFVLVFSIIGIAIAIALYSNFLPYFALLGDIKNYNVAYYGAQTAVERSLSVLRYRDAGFQGSGGWMGTSTSGPVSDTENTYLSDRFRSLTREIQGRTDDQIPVAGQGNIEYRLLSGASNDYNMLSYNNPLRLPLSVDDTLGTSAYISSSYIVPYNGAKLNIQIRLNPVVQKIFDPDGDKWNLCVDIDNSGDGITNDVIVDRGRKGKFDGSNDFSIIPRNTVTFNTGSATWLVDAANDASIREGDINTMSDDGDKIVLFGDTRNPLNALRDRSTSFTGHLMIASQSLIDQIAGNTFKDLLTNAAITDQELTLFLTRLLETCVPDSKIYPFLEYKIAYDTNSSSTYLPDPWFRIHGKSQVGGYTVNMYVRKSINKDDTLSSFTVVF